MASSLKLDVPLLNTDSTLSCLQDVQYISFLDSSYFNQERFINHCFWNFLSLLSSYSAKKTGIWKLTNANACAKHHKSFRDYELLCRLDRVKGVDMGRRYSNYIYNDKACSMFVKSIKDLWCFAQAFAFVSFQIPVFLAEIGTVMFRAY
jgi:hypothetical protein